MRAMRWQDPEDRIQNDTLETPVNREIRVRLRITDSYNFKKRAASPPGTSEASSPSSKVAKRPPRLTARARR
jgi:hypothetical protein